MFLDGFEMRKIHRKKNKSVCWEEITLWDSFVEECTYDIMLNA